MRFFKEKEKGKVTVFIKLKSFVSLLFTLTSRLVTIYVQNPSRILLLMLFAPRAAVRLLCRIITFDLKIPS